jgi:hypothetical protein
MPTNTIIISCSIFKNEIEHLKTEGKINVPVVYVNSMLHMVPKELQAVLDAKIEEFKSFNIILAFGDCHARMIDYSNNKNIVRTPGINCCEIFLGSADYKRIRKEGAFILMPEWADRWKEVFMDYMGFKKPKELNEFMTDMHKKLVYVDTGFKKRNSQVLNELVEYTGLPLEIYQSSISNLEAVLVELIKNEKNN